MLNWSKKKVLVWYVISHIILFLLIFVAPLVTIVLNYSVDTEGSAIAMTGKCILVGFIVYGALKAKKLANKLPKGVFKYTLFMLFQLVQVGVLFFIIHMFKSNFDLASKTITICLIFISIAIVFENVFVVYLDDVVYLDQQAKEKLQIEERAKKIDK